jgi:hypothetical protein
MVIINNTKILHSCKTLLTYEFISDPHIVIKNPRVKIGLRNSIKKAVTWEPRQER